MENNGMDEKRLLEFIRRIVQKNGFTDFQLTELQSILEKQGCCKEADLVGQARDDYYELSTEIKGKSTINMLDMSIAHRRAEERRERVAAASSGGCR